MHKRIATLILLLISGFNTVLAQLSFDHLSVSNGLSQSTVISIHKDQRGLMWFGTRDGLNRYDGRQIKVYKNTPEDPQSISTSDYIYSIEEDAAHSLWIGTQKGLNHYAPETDAFEQIFHNDKDVNSLSNSTVISICAAKDGKLWFGTNNGLSMLENSSSRKFINRYQKDGLAGNEVYCVFEDSRANIWVGTTTGLSLLQASPSGKYQIRNAMFANSGLHKKSIKTIVEDREGKIWIGTAKNGIYIYHPDRKSLTHISSRPYQNGGLSNDLIRKIILAKDGRLWIATMDGLNIFNPATKIFDVYKHDSDNRKSLSDNSIKDIYEDDKGSVWIGTNFGGINVAHQNAVTFKVYSHSKYRNSISTDIISVIASGRNGRLLIGTEGHGLNIFDIKNNFFKHFKHDRNNKSGISSNTIKSIFRDRSGAIWVGLFENGLERFDPDKGTFEHFRPDPDNPNALSYGYVSSITQDQGGRIWVGTSSKGLNIFRPGTRDFIQVNSGSKGLKINNDYVRTVMGDSRGNVWLGTAAGLSILRNGENQFEQFDMNQNGLKSDYINCIKEDQNHRIWIGSHRGGLSLYLPNRNKFLTYTSADGLASDNVVGIEQDDEGNIWISTDRGLSKFDLKRKKFKNYYMSDGLPSNEFSYNAAFKAEDGTLFFGSYNGLVSFKPQAIDNNGAAPAVMFSALRLFNKPVSVNGEEGLLKKDISFTKAVTFKASQNIFTIDFVALNYIKPERNKYAYKLHGFEESWNEVDVPSATYTNLPPGSYKLLVKASNGDGNWSENPAMLHIKVLPPLWKTWWAYMIYVTLVALILVYINRFLRRQERLETDLYYEHVNNERQQALYQHKLDFFTRISHEIRTPLTLIFAPLEKLIQQTQENHALNLQLQGIKKNTERLLRLISELLDFRKMETGNLKLQVEETEICAFCQHIYDAFREQAEIKQIGFKFQRPDNGIYVYIDQSQMEKVLFNLLSNAFKFTPAEGKVSLKIEENHQQVDIILMDNGIGISQEHQENIFTNFYQVKDERHSPTGWGIGLALVKTIVDLHKGSIKLRSEPAAPDRIGYTEFKVTLLKGFAHFAPDQLIHNEDVSLSNQTLLEHGKRMDVAPEPNPDNANLQDKKSVLVVEDNDELRAFIIQSLQDKYSVSGCVNGEEAWHFAIANIPDMIISDVTMPVMDGYEFCAKIKNEERTSHIPVIMLTAMASHLHQVDGLEAGADTYLTKPFSIQVLELNVRNILASKESLKHKYSRQVRLMPRNVEITSPDEIFLDKLMQLTEARLEDPNFNVAVLVDEIGMSQTVLYKKIKALTDLSITDFIKSVRLKRAAQLLEEEKLSIAEVAYSVGFNDRKYFSKEFKKQFGKAPSEYIAHNLSSEE